jgi:hypothetical protein
MGPDIGRSAHQERQTSHVVGVSSSRFEEVGPGGAFVVVGVGFQAAVEDADEPVGELAEGGLVPGAAVAECQVVGAGSW